MESSFQFKNPTITKLVFELNDGFDREAGKEINIPHKLTHNVVKNEDKIATVSLTIEVGERSSEFPFYILATEESMFKWDENTKDEKPLLKQNAPALLLSYLRPIVATVTAASPFGSYNLPFINFSNK